MLSILSVLMLSNSALAVPIQVNQQGRLLYADGEGLTGSHQLIFQLYDEQTGGDIQWAESITVQFNNGYYSTMLGTDEETNPLDNSIFANYPLYLELKVNGEALSPRHQLTSVPYAQIAGVAESVDGGTVRASEIIVGGQTVIDGDGNWVGPGMTDTLSSLSCALGEIAGWNGSAWTCVSDNTLTYTDIENYLLNNPIDLNVNTTIGGSTVVSSVDDSDTLASLSCVNDGEIARYDLALGEWYCDADIDTVLDEATVETYITNGAIDLNSGTTIGGATIVTTGMDADTLAGLSCTNGQVAKYNTGTGLWACGDDVDTDTTLSEGTVETYVTNGAIDLNASTTIGGSEIIPQPVGCTDSQVLIYNAGTSSWVCGDEIDTLASLGCADGETAQYSQANGWQCVSGASSAEVVSIGTLQSGASFSYTLQAGNSDVNLQFLASENGVWVPVTPTSSVGQACDECGDGSDGSFQPQLSISLPCGTYNFSDVHIPAGVTISTSGTEPMVWNVRGDTIIDGEVSISPGTCGGGSWTLAGACTIVGTATGKGVNGSYYSTGRIRAGGGGTFASVGGGTDPDGYVNTNVYWAMSVSEPIGGSPGGGSIGSDGTCVSGGFGGGVLKITANAISVVGSILANGGDGRTNGPYLAGGAGSGGHLWLRSNTTNVFGNLEARGGLGVTITNSATNPPTVTSGDGGNGYIRLASPNLTVSGTTIPSYLTESYTPTASSTVISYTLSDTGDIVITNNSSSAVTMKMVASQ